MADGQRDKGRIGKMEKNAAADQAQAGDAGADSPDTKDTEGPDGGLIDLDAAEKQLKAMAKADAASGDKGSQGAGDSQTAPADGSAKDGAAAGDSQGGQDTAPDGSGGDAEAFRPSDEQLAMAKSLGVPAEEIRTMTEAQAQAYVMAGKQLSRRMSEAGRKRQADKDKESAAAEGKTKAGETDGTQDGGGQASSDQSPEAAFSNDEDWGTEGGASKINALAAQVKAQGQLIEGLTGRLEERTDEVTASKADGFFETLDPEIFPEAADETFQTKVLQAAATAKRLFAEEWQQELTDDEALERGLAVVDAEGARAAAAASVRKAVADRKKQITSRPSQRQTGGKHFRDDKEEAAHKIAEEARAMGMTGVHA